MSPQPWMGRGVRVGAVLLAVLAAAAASGAPARAEEAMPLVDVDGSNGYPSQAPVAGWIKEITTRNAKVQTLVGSYEYLSLPRGRAKPLIETGTVKLRFAAEPNRPPQERWEGKSDEGKVLRIVRDGRVHLQVNDKVTPHAVTDPDKLSPSMVRFPLLPEACAARFQVWYAASFEPGTTGPVAGRPFPTALCLVPRQGMDTSPRLKRFYLALEGDTGLAYKIRWHEMDGAHSVIELFDTKANVAVTDADFAMPGGGSPAAAEKDRKAGEAPK